MKKRTKVRGEKRQTRAKTRGEGVSKRTVGRREGLIGSRKIISQKGKPALIQKKSKKRDSGQPRALKKASKEPTKTKANTPAKESKTLPPARDKRSNEETPKKFPIETHEGPTVEDYYRLIGVADIGEAIPIMDEGLGDQIRALNMMPWHPDDMSALFDRLLFNVRANLFRNTGHERKAAQLMSSMAYRAINALEGAAKYRSSHWAHQDGITAAKEFSDELQGWMRRRVTKIQKAEKRSKKGVQGRTNSHSFIRSCKYLIAGAVGTVDTAYIGGRRPAQPTRMRYFDRLMPVVRFGSCDDPEARKEWAEYLYKMLERRVTVGMLSREDWRNNQSRLKRKVIPELWDKADEFRAEFLPDA
jgi:hypothetical protein